MNSVFYPEFLTSAYNIELCKMPEHNPDPQIFASCQNLDEETVVFKHNDTCCTKVYYAYGLFNSSFGS
jgi:hypothetical protein